MFFFNDADFEFLYIGAIRETLKTEILWKRATQSDECFEKMNQEIFLHSVFVQSKAEGKKLYS